MLKYILWFYSTTRAHVSYSGRTFTNNNKPFYAMRIYKITSMRKSRIIPESRPHKDFVYMVPAREIGMAVNGISTECQHPLTSANNWSYAQKKKRKKKEEEAPFSFLYHPPSQVFSSFFLCQKCPFWDQKKWGGQSYVWIYRLLSNNRAKSFVRKAHASHPCF